MKSEVLMSAYIGVTGLAVIGANLTRNLARNGFPTLNHLKGVSHWKTNDKIRLLWQPMGS
jgi:6-phosphogluconate dehydrogenase